MNNLRHVFAWASIALIFISSPLSGQTAPEQQAYSYAQQLYQDGLYEIAIEQYRQYLANYPRGNQRPEAALQIGEAYYQLGDYEQALKAFLQVDLDYPGTDEALEGLWSVGESYEALGRFEEAARAFNRLYVYYPDSERAPRALIRGGADAQKAGNEDLAVELLQTAIDEYYQSAVANDARIQLAKVYRQQLEFRMAWTELERALNNTNDKNQRGVIILEQAKTAEQLFTPERAEELYLQIVEEFEESSLINEARLELGRLAIIQKNYTAAEEYLIQVENSESADYRLRALEYHGDLFWQQGAFEEAKGYYMQALNLEAPLEIRQALFLKSALAAEKMGDFNQAFQQLQTITDREVTGDIDESILKAAYDHLASSAVGIERYRDALTALNNLK
ncbi:MAG: tetratricopeptide repeat protein, partial [Candidatus Marinimicrobia bacterium]|nr:tetratricopeptide repeat protein [Candidatus Neomarinimicrobiota bacterium]